MKAFAFVLLIAAATAFAPAQNPRPAPSAPASSLPGGESAAELAALDQFLRLSDAELAQMELVIARIRAMTREQRAAMQQQIAAFRQLPEEKRQQMRMGWGWMPPEIQAGWREMMQNATPERHAEVQNKLQSLSPEEKTRYRRELVEAYLKAKAAKR